MSLRPSRLAPLLFLATACGGGGDKADKPAAAKSEKKAEAKADDGKAADAAAAQAEPDDAPAGEAASATTEGKLTVTLGGEEKVFDKLDAKSNFVMATSLAIVAENAAGEQLRINGIGLTIPGDTKFPLVLESEDPQEYMKHHKAHLAGKAERRLQRNLGVTYTNADGQVWFTMTEGKLTVESYEDGKLVGTLAAATLRPKKDGDPIELEEGSVEVQMMTPAAGRIVEKAVAGK